MLGHEAQEPRRCRTPESNCRRSGEGDSAISKHIGRDGRDPLNWQYLGGHVMRGSPPDALTKQMHSKTRAQRASK
eukprot:10082116-Alexandrium_andersonii.AAC.1